MGIGLKCLPPEQVAFAQDQPQTRGNLLFTATFIHAVQLRPLVSLLSLLLLLSQTLSSSWLTAMIPQLIIPPHSLVLLLSHLHFTPGLILKIPNLLYFTCLKCSISPLPSGWRLAWGKKSDLILNLVYVSIIFSSHREFGLEKASSLKTGRYYAEEQRW